jgi:hypothetical protein
MDKTVIVYGISENLQDLGNIFYEALCDSKNCQIVSDLSETWRRPAYEIVISSSKGDIPVVVILSQVDPNLTPDITHIWLNMPTEGHTNVVGITIDERSSSDDIVLLLLRIATRDEDISLGIQASSISNNKDRSKTYMDISYLDLSIILSS